MSNKILFLYFKQKHKAELIKCENILKALFRKFRKSVVFSYMQIDTSSSCRDAFNKVLSDEIGRHHAFLIKSDTENFLEEEIFIKEILRLKASQYHTAGKVICFPSSVKTVEVSDDIVAETYTTNRKNLKYAAELSLKLANRRKHLLSICTRPDLVTDSTLFSIFEDSADKSLHINSEHISFDEMISVCTKTIPSFDVVLTTEAIAKIIAMHLDSSAKVCSGNAVLYTEKGTFHMSRTSGRDEMSNAHFASVLLTFSEILSDEFSMNTASDWLRKAVATSFETHAFTPFDEFSDKVISEIQKPMRYTR